MARRSLILGLAAILFIGGPFLLNSAAQQRCPGTLNVNFRMQQQTSRYYQDQMRQLQFQFQQQQTQRMQQMQRQYMRKVSNVPPPITRTAKTIVPQRFPATVVSRQPTPISFTKSKLVTSQPKLTTVAKSKVVMPKTKVTTSTITRRPPPIKFTIPEKNKQMIVQRSTTKVQPKRQWVLPEKIPVKAVKKTTNPIMTAKMVTTPGREGTRIRTTMSLTMDFKCFQCHRQNNNMLTRQATQHALNLARQPGPPVPLAIVQPRLPSPLRTMPILPTNPIQLASARVLLPAPVPVQKANLERPAANLDLPDMPHKLVLHDPIEKPKSSLSTIEKSTISRLIRPSFREEVHPNTEIDGPVFPSLPTGAFVLPTPAPPLDDDLSSTPGRLASSTLYSRPAQMHAPDFAPLSSRPFLPLLSR